MVGFINHVILIVVVVIMNLIRPYKGLERPLRPYMPDGTASQQFLCNEARAPHCWHCPYRGLKRTLIKAV